MVAKESASEHNLNGVPSVSSPAAANRMTSVPSPEGRRILVAVVTGEAGERIQAWRLQHDREQAERLPPHATLCYWAPTAEPEQLEQQVRHAFCAPVDVRLGAVGQGDSDQRTFFVEVQDTSPLDDALVRLYDGTHVSLPPVDHWRWHVTCVRDSRGRDQDALWAAAKDLTIDAPWTVDTVAYLELKGGAYSTIASWHL